MGEFGALIQLLTSGDLAKIMADYPQVRADINQTCNDMINLATGVKKLLRDLTPITDVLQKL